MSILDDIKRLDNLKDNILNDVKSPEQLMEKIQGIQDIVDQHIHELEGIPELLQRWKDTLENLKEYSLNTDFPSIFEFDMFKSIWEKSQEIIDSATAGLFDKAGMISSIKHKEILFYSINDVKIDYIYEPNPSYKTTTESQPIVSSSNIDRLNENAENENPTIKYKCILVGSDAQERFDKINDLRQNKQLVKIVTNKVFEKLLITSLKPYYDCSPNTLEFEISLEKIFVAELIRKRKRETKERKTDSFVLKEKPINKFQVPMKSAQDMINYQLPDIGTINSINFENYVIDDAFKNINAKNNKIEIKNIGGELDV